MGTIVRAAATAGLGPGRKPQHAGAARQQEEARVGEDGCQLQLQLCLWVTSK